MSDTPRTDAECRAHALQCGMAHNTPWEHARTLERDLASARERIEELLVDRDARVFAGLQQAVELGDARARITALEAERDELRKIAKEDFIISLNDELSKLRGDAKQLREVVQLAKRRFRLLALYIAHNGDDWVNREATESLNQIDAALTPEDNSAV